MDSGGVTRLAGRPRLSRRADGLALRRAMPDRLLPALVAAMTFLAALALAGAVGATLLAERWSSGAASVLTVQVPDGETPVAGGQSGTRVDAVLTVLRGDPAFASANKLDRARLQALLAPWLGSGGIPAPAPGPTAIASSTPAPPQPADPVPIPPAPPSETIAPALSLPSVIQARLQAGIAVPPDLERRLDAAAPGTVAEHSQPWTERLVALTTSLQACAGLALLVVTGVAVAVVAAATRAGLAARRHSIEIVHGLGAGDGYIAGRFARRTTGLAFGGGVVGMLLSVPLLLLLCRLGAPFAGIATAPIGAEGGNWLMQALARVPLPLWIALPLLPPIAATIGWATAQATVRTWLRRLP